MMRLSVCRRSDRELFELYADVSKVEVKDFPTKLYQKNICYLNSTRKAINRYWMLKLVPKHKPRKLVKAHPRAKQSQDTYVYKGLPVIAAVTRSGMGFANAEEFTVSDLDENNIYLQCIEDKDRILTIPVSEFTYCFQPAYAVSCHRAQGSSISESFGIFDWDKMDDKLKYVALSRSRKLKYINMCSQAQLEVL
jgi:ATP-dependent exoDNAse (exonuclease V) alpha subunit